MPGQFVNEDYPYLAPAVLNTASGNFTGAIGRTARAYNTLLVDVNGTVTVSGAGADAGYAVNDIIDRFTLKLTPGVSDKGAAPEQFQLINNVRFFALYQFSRDYGFVAPVTNAGAGTGSPAVRSTFALPVGFVNPEDSLTWELSTNPFATVGTTITAWSVTLTFRPLMFGAGQGPTGTNLKTNLIGYKEYILDVVASGASAIVQMKPGPGMSKWKLGCLFVIRNESARGTLADGWDWFQAYVNGVPVAGIQTPEIVHKVRASLKSRILQVAGIMPVWFSPTPVTEADYFEYDNEATATVAGTTVLGVYVVSR